MRGTWDESCDYNAMAHMSHVNNGYIGAQNTDYTRCVIPPPRKNIRWEVEHSVLAPQAAIPMTLNGTPGRRDSIVGASCDDTAPVGDSGGTLVP